MKKEKTVQPTYVRPAIAKQVLAAGAANYTIQSYQGWDKIADYESDETTVTLLNERVEIEAEFNYPQFTKADFDHFRSTCR